MPITTIEGVRIEHNFDFDPSYGYTLEDLLAVSPPAETPGFANYWKRRFDHAIATRPRPVLRKTQTQFESSKLYDLYFRGSDGLLLGGRALIPRSGVIKRGIVFAHGYGCPEEPDSKWALPDTVVIFPHARGFGRSQTPGVPADPNQHVIHRIEHRDCYVIGHCVEDLWLAVSALHELFPQTRGRTMLAGGSFGGGLGTLAMAWDRRVQCGHFEVPTFGHQPLRAQLPTQGSGRSVQAILRQTPSIAEETLAYFDAACAARHITVPVHFSCARFDPSVAPPGQFAIYNATAPALRSLTIKTVGHFDSHEQPEENQAEWDQIRRLLCFEPQLLEAAG